MPRTCTSRRLADGLPAGVNTIVPGAKLEFTALYRPSAPGVRRAMLTITHNPGEVNVRLEGTGVIEQKPEIEVSPLSVNFGQIFAIEQTGSAVVTVENIGNLNLVVENVEFGPLSSPDFSFTGETSFTLVPGSSKGIPLSYEPQEVSNASGTLVITSNDADEGTVTVSLEGQAIGGRTSAAGPWIQRTGRL